MVSVAKSGERGEVTPRPDGLTQRAGREKVQDMLRLLGGIHRRGARGAGHRDWGRLGALCDVGCEAKSQTRLAF